MDARHTNITITTGTIVRGLLVLVLFGLIYYLRDLALIILTAIVIASSIEPAIIWFKKKRVPRLPAVIIIYLLLAISFVGLVYFFVPPLLNEMLGFLNTLPSDLRNIDLNDLIHGPQLLTSSLSIPSSSDGLANQIGSISSVVSTLSGNFFKTTGAIFGSIISFILIVVLSFYFAVLETGVDDFLRIVTPVKYENYVVNLWKRSQAKIGLWMQGQVVLGLIVGVLVYLGLTILSVPYALFLAIIAAIFEIIPVFGPILSAIPAVVLGFADGGFTAGLFVVGLFVIIQQFENHLIYPLVVRKVVGVPPILVIIALIIGGNLAGFLGILLSVPVSAALKEYIDDIERHKNEERRRLQNS